VAQLGTLTEPDDIDAIISGTMAAVYRLVHGSYFDANPATTVELIRAVAAKIGGDAA
jgi:hypothetical protein